MKKRISLTVEKEPYELFKKNSRLVGLGDKWFSQEIDKLVQGLNEIIQVVVDTAEQGKKLTEEERKKLIVKTAEDAFGVKLKDLQK